MHDLLTSVKSSIRYGTIDIRICYYNIMSRGTVFILIESLCANSACSVRLGSNSF